jgi:hypothetical protein
MEAWHRRDPPRYCGRDPAPPAATCFLPARRHVQGSATGRPRQSHHWLQSYRLGEIMTPIMKITHHFLARVGQVNKATLAT